MAVKSAIIGVGQTKYRTQSELTWPELAEQAARVALQHAGMSMSDIDAVVLGLAPSPLIGVNMPERWVVDSIGAAGKPFMRINTGGTTGASAAQAGWLHVVSGMFKRVLVVSADKVAESADAQSVLNVAFDPIFEKSLGINAINMCSFQALRHMKKYGSTVEQFARVAVRCRGNGARNPMAHLRKPLTLEEALASRNICYPIKLADCCPRSSGAAAIVIASEDVVRGKSTRPAWIRGVGERTNTALMGDRMGPALETDFADWDELAMAAHDAYTMAGISNPAKEISVAEVYAPFSCNELPAIEALGLCSKGQAGPLDEEGAWDMDGRLPVNPSGGTLCANPISATALVRVCDAAAQIMGCAEGYQVKDASIAVATGVGGSLQFHTCVVLGSDM